MSRNIFASVGNLQVGKSVFDLSYEKKFTCDMGELIPVLCDELVPGDFVKLGNEAIIRFQPLVAPILHEINMFVHYFFVPYRLLWNAQTREDLSESGDWEEFITGGADGANADTIPLWSPVDSSSKGTLWDYMGMPLVADPDGYLPIDFPRRAYNLVYNEFYRDENLISPVAWDNDDILIRSWEKDYFTSLLPWQQRGTAPALPISGSVPVTGIGAKGNSYASGPVSVYETDGSGTVNYANYKVIDAASDPAGVFRVEEDPNNTGYPNIRAELDNATTFDVADLRLAFQIQNWMERNARSGARYTEFLRAHFGISPRDERLQRPEYIGGSKSAVIVSEVLQTSQTDTTPQGTLAGHGLSASSNYVGKYKASEFGLVIGIMSVMPKPVYNSQGINRQWLRETRYDFYFPEFANLSEQAVEAGEIFVTTASSSTSETILGYQGRYDEMRIKQNLICDDMRDTYDYWHLSRQFSSSPTLNQSFLECVPRKDIFAAPSEPGLIISFGNLIKAFRPIPIQAEPGLIDH